jgi:hypothetical protein
MTQTLADITKLLDDAAAATAVVQNCYATVRRALDGKDELPSDGYRLIDAPGVLRMWHDVRVASNMAIEVMTRGQWPTSEHYEALKALRDEERRQVRPKPEPPPVVANLGTRQLATAKAKT